MGANVIAGFLLTIQRFNKYMTLRYMTDTSRQRIQQRYYYYYYFFTLGIKDPEGFGKKLM